MPAVTLPDRAVLSVSGPDAHHFLHTILTCDIEGQAVGTTLPGALLTPQGKILFDFMAMRTGAETWILDCREETAASFIQRLNLYRLRAKVEITEQNESVVSVWWDGDSPPSSDDSGVARDVRFAQTPVFRAVGSAHPEGGLQAWTALRIAHGVAESGSDYALGDAFPHDVNLDQTGGVSFKKGCYVGQEVVSRMHHRGTARRRVLIASAARDLPPPGTAVTAGGKPAGALGSVTGSDGLALVRIDRVKAAMDAGAPIEADGVALTLSIPPGATFAFPDAATADSDD